MLNNLNNSTATIATTKNSNTSKEELDIYRLVQLNFNKLDSSSNSNSVDLFQRIDDLISHILAHALLNNTDTDLFLSIYDKIPSDFSQTRIDYIKNRSLEISELDEEEFKLNCLSLNCDYSNFIANTCLEDTKTSAIINTNSDANDDDVVLSQNSDNIGFELDECNFFKIKMSDSNNNKNNNKINTTGDITLNEQFFNDKQNKFNSNLNPLLSNNNITVINQKLLNSMLDDESNKAKSTSSFNLPPLISSTATATTNISAISRDGFVTNHRYQTLKDNKRSESQLTTCYDEVYAAKSDDNVDSVDEEDDDELDTSKEKKRSDSFSSRSSSSSSSSSIKSKKSMINKTSSNHEAVVINMEKSDDEDFIDDENYSIKYKQLDTQGDEIGLSEIGKEKFESLVHKKELEMSTQSKLNEDLKEMTPSDAVYENKYEQDESLLKNYENECRYGLKSKPERFSYFNYSRNLTNSSMKNDFSKNEDEEDSAEYYSGKAQMSNRLSTANVQTKVLLNNKKPPYPSTSTSTYSLATNSIGTSTNASFQSLSNEKTSEESTELLDSLVYTLADKLKDKLPKSNTPNKSTMQINNYETNVDDIVNLKLKPIASNSDLNDDYKHEESSWNYLSTSASTTAKTLGNKDVDEVKNKTGSISSTSSSSSGAGYTSSKLGNRPSIENNMDSHGSSLTNSSKQDDEEEEYEEENEANEDLTIDESEYGQSRKGLMRNVSCNKPANKDLQETIEELGQRHVNETLSNNKTSHLSTFRPLDSTKLPPLKGITPKGTHLPLSTSSTTTSTYPITLNATNNSTLNKNIGSSNSGAFHKKYKNLNYDPYLINPNTTLIQPDPNVKSYNTFNNYNNPIQTSHLDPSSEAKPSQASNKNNKRMNKKSKSKGSVDLNNPENTMEFSKHYTEDVDSLLEFINSSSANPNENKNKTVKKSEPNKKEKATKGSTNEKAQARTKSNDNNKNQNNNNAKRKSSNETENSETKKPDEKINKENEAKPPKPEQEVVQDTKANEQIKKVENNPAKEKPSPPVRPSIEEHYDELNSLMESASIKSNDEEFVIVKGGRKLRKSNKPNENAAPQQIPPATNQPDTNKNKNFKAQSNKNQPQPQPSSNKQENAKPIAKPANQSSQQPSAKPTTNISYNKIVKKDEPTVVNTQASSNQAQASYKLKQDENKPSAAKTTTENSSASTFLDKQSGINLEVFPPLTPANLNVESKPAAETTKDQVEATEPTNKPVVSANQDKAAEAEAKPSSNQAANSKTTTKKANKLEFLDFRGSNSVIFLDEISQNKANSTSTVGNDTKASQNTQQLKQKLAVTSNVLNGIKFGFIDSSSSDEDEANNKSVKNIDETNTNKNLDSTSGVDDRSVIIFMSNTDLNQLASQEAANNVKSSEMTDEDKDKQRKKKPSKYTKHKSNYASSKSKSSSSSAISSHRTASSTSSDEYEQEPAATKPNKPKKPKSLSKRAPNKKSYPELDEQQQQTNETSWNPNDSTAVQMQPGAVEPISNPIMNMPMMINNSQSQTTYLNQTQQIYYYPSNQLNPAYVAAFYAAVNNGNSYAIAGYPPQTVPHNLYYQQAPYVYPHMPNQAYYPPAPAQVQIQPNQQPHEPSVVDQPSDQSSKEAETTQQSKEAESSLSSSPKSQSSLNNEQSGSNNNQPQAQEVSNVQTTSSTASTPTPESTAQSEQSNTNAEAQNSQQQLEQQQQPQQPVAYVQMNPEYSQSYPAQYAPMPIPTAYLPRAPYPYSYIQAPVDYMPQGHMMNQPPMATFQSPDGIIQMPIPGGYIPAQMAPNQVPPNPAYITQPIMHSNIPPHVQMAPNTNPDNFRYESNRKDQSDLNNQRNYQKPYRYKNNRNNNNRNNYQQNRDYSHQQHQYYPPQQHYQPQFHPQVYNNNQMPEGAPALNEYRGDFNLDEAAFYVAEQWNNVKQP